MKKRLCTMITVVLVLLLCYGCDSENYTYFRPETFSMFGAQVDNTVAVIDECTLSFSIVKDRSIGSKYTRRECSVVFSEGATLNELKLATNEPDEKYDGFFYFYTGLVYLKDTGDAYNVSMYLDSDQSCCLIHVSERDLYFVASVDENFDPKEVFAKFMDQQ